MDRPSVWYRWAIEISVSPRWTVYSANVGAGVGVGGPGVGVGVGGPVGVGGGDAEAGGGGLTAAGRQAARADAPATTAMAMDHDPARRPPIVLTPPRPPWAGRPASARRA